MPVAFMMGTDWEDCREVAELIGIKTFVNEFVAYIRLADMIDNGVISVSKFCCFCTNVVPKYVGLDKRTSHLFFIPL